MVSQNLILINEVIYRGGAWFIRSTIFSMGEMGRLKGSGMVGRDGREVN